MGSNASPLMPVSAPPGGGGDATATRNNMMSVVPADLFDDVSGISPDGITETDEPIEAAPVEDEPIEAVEDVPADEPVGDPPADAPPADAAPPDAAAPPEELPEGVRKGKDSKGKDKYFLEPNRYETFHAHHRLVQDASEQLGEPLTLDSIKLHNDAYQAQERLFSTLESGDTTAQAEAVRFMLDDMREAHANGEVGVDPTIPFAETVYTTLRDSAPDAYANLRLMAAKDLLSEMFERAGTTGNLDLLRSANHVAMNIAGIGPKAADVTAEQYLAHVSDSLKRAGLPFYTDDQLASLSKPTSADDPIAARDRRIAELESQVNGKSTTNAAEQFATWNRTHTTEVNKAIFGDAVKPSLTEAEKAWAKYPDDYARLVVDPLNREVTKAIGGDQALNRQVGELQAKAARATSEQVRQDIGARIKQLVINRAKMAVDKAKGPILATAAKTLKGLSDQTHDRRQGAQDRTVPKGQTTPVNRSVLPNTVQFKDNKFDAATAVKQATQLLAALR